MHHIKADIAIIGGSFGGVAAALAVAKRGDNVILVGEHQWLGGQLTVQGVPLDEHPWADTGIGSQNYQDLRGRIRNYYRRNYPLTFSARQNKTFNPGQGNISTLTHEPVVAAAVIDEMLQPWAASGRLQILRNSRVVHAESSGSTLTSVTVVDKNTEEYHIEARIFIDATELGELLPLAGADYVIGAESQSDTGELHALAQADPLEQQSVTWCFALDYRPGEDHTIAKPPQYEQWKTLQIPSWPGPQFSWLVSDHVTHEPRERPLFAAAPGPEWQWDLWHARRVFSRFQYERGFSASDVTLANWPQMDYWLRPFLGVDQTDYEKALQESKEFSKAFLYWMQVEAPRWDGGFGYPELRLRPDVLGTNDGFAMEPYFRDSRRLLAEVRVVEQDIGVKAREGCANATKFRDSVGIGAYRIDIHPSTRQRNTIDIDTYPYQIPLGSLISRNVQNLLAGCKNAGLSRIASAAYRVHPTEWSIGEAAGHVASFSIAKNASPSGVRADPALLQEFQEQLRASGVDLQWPEFGPLTPTSRQGWKEANAIKA